jgi:FtsP/CotA-like multicopper oxidase with cupredoxin domain
MSKPRRLLAGFVIVGVVIALLLITGAILIRPPSGSGNFRPLVSTAKAECVRPPGFILIIADLSGFNNSIAHGAPLNPWPIVRVHLGDVVRFIVCNKDQTQAHGFAIETYFDSGVALAPGEAVRIEFQATIPGSFVIYCNIFCTVHAFMVGRLIVSS